MTSVADRRRALGSSTGRRDGLLAVSESRRGQMVFIASDALGASAPPGAKPPCACPSRIRRQRAPLQSGIAAADQKGTVLLRCTGACRIRIPGRRGAFGQLDRIRTVPSIMLKSQLRDQCRLLVDECPASSGRPDHMSAPVSQIAVGCSGSVIARHRVE